MRTPGKYCFYFIAIVLSAIMLSSCGGAHKVTTSTAPAIMHKQLSPKEQNELTDIYFDANKEKILGNYDKALALFNQCLTIDPGNAAANYEMADIFEFYKQPDTALVYARRSATIEPTNVWYQDLYAQCLQEKGRYKEMIPIYQNLIQDHPNEFDYYYKLAMAQIEGGDMEKAADTYDKLEESKAVIVKI